MWVGLKLSKGQVCPTSSHYLGTPWGNLIYNAEKHTSHWNTEFLVNGASPSPHFIEVHLQLVAPRVGHVQGVQAQLNIILIFSLVRNGHMSPVLTVPATVATQIATDEQRLRISIVINSVQVHLSDTLLKSTVPSMTVVQASIKFHTALFFPLQVCCASAFPTSLLIRTGLEVRTTYGMYLYPFKNISMDLQQEHLI